MITIGIDPHKSSHTAAAVGERGELIAELRVAADRSTTKRLLTWAGQWPERRWAIEGAGGLGRLLAQHLVIAGETVMDVPAKLAARVRLLDAGHGRKTDGIDAISVASAALRGRGIHPVVHEDSSSVLRLLSDRRDELSAERRRSVNRLHRVLRDLVRGGAPRQLSATRAATILRAIRPSSAVDAERKTIARELLADVRRLDRALAQNRQRCAEAVAVADTSLVEVFGVSDVLATKIIGHARDITRFASADHFATYSGTAPIEASSGDTKRHRLSRWGNRSLNNALHLTARVQTMHAGPGRTYYERKLAEGKSPAEALRCLKRQLAKVVYRHLLADHRRHSLAAV